MSISCGLLCGTDSLFEGVDLLFDLSDSRFDVHDASHTRAGRKKAGHARDGNEERRERRQGARKRNFFVRGRAVCGAPVAVAVVVVVAFLSFFFSFPLHWTVLTRDRVCLAAGVRERELCCVALSCVLLCAAIWLLSWFACGLWGEIFFFFSFFSFSFLLGTLLVPGPRQSGGVGKC